MHTKFILSIHSYIFYIYYYMRFNLQNTIGVKTTEPRHEDKEDSNCENNVVIDVTKIEF